MVIEAHGCMRKEWAWCSLYKDCW